MIELDQSKRKGRPNTNIIKVSSAWNRYSTYPSAGLTPLTLTSIFKEADQGNVYRQSELFEEMLEKDTRLFAALQSRKLAVAGKDYQIIAATEDKKDKDIADFVKTAFNGIRNFRKTLEDILDAVGKGFSMNQIIWKSDGGKILIDRIEYAHQKNFRFGKASDVTSDLTEIRRLTDDNRFDGIDLEENKWVTSVIQARSGSPSRTSILRTCTWMYLFKNFDVKAWVQFAELYGQPIRIGKYNSSTSDTDKDTLLEALADLGTDAYALISDTTAIEFIEAAQKAASAALHNDLASFCNAEMSVAVLGHTGAIESTPGKLGSEDTAKEIRFDLIESDALALDYIISDQLIAPLVRFNFGPQEQYPYYKTSLKPPVDKMSLVELYDGAINRIGIPVGKQHVYDALGIPIPAEGDEVIIPRPQTNPFGMKYNLLNSFSASDKKKNQLKN